LQENRNAEEYQQELNALNAEMGTEQILYNTLPDGPRREAARLNMLEIDLKLGRLRSSEDTYGGFATVMRALSLNNVLSYRSTQSWKQQPIELLWVNNEKGGEGGLGAFYGALKQVNSFIF